MEDLRELFPIKDHYSYFMTSAAGPVPRPSQIALSEFGKLLMETGSVEFPRWLKIMESTRKSASRLLSCQTDSLAFVKNTGVGLSIASRMIDWQPGDEIILPAGEFPSNIYPWLSLEELGVKVRWIEPVSKHPIPQVTRQTVLPYITEKTRALSVSFVQFDDGARRDMCELSSLCKEHGIAFVVDAIQGLGALPFSLDDFEADFVCAGSQKWLLSPPGAGLLYVNPRYLGEASCKVPNLGWLSLEDPFNTAPGSYSDSLKRVLPNAKRFEEGTPNFPVIAALGSSIDIILDQGIESISARIKSLTDYLIRKLEELDCRIVSPRSDSSWSGIVSFLHPRLDSVEVEKQFTEEKIITTVRNGWVRVALDFFNDEEELDKLVASLKSQLDRSVVH